MTAVAGRHCVTNGAFGAHAKTRPLTASTRNLFHTQCVNVPVVRTIGAAAFKGFRYLPEVIVLAVRWYFRFGLSYRDVQELLTDRGIEVDHVTVYRWVQRFTPLLADAARPCRHTVGDRWFVDETYVKVAERWRYVCTGR